MKYTTCAVLLLANVTITLPVSVMAEDLQKTYSISKYIGVEVDAGYQQTNLTEVVGSFDFNKDIELIGQAINYALSRSGYSLSSYKKMDKESLILLSHPLPQVHRTFSWVTLEGVIKALVGQGYTVRFDHVAREVIINKYTPSTPNSK